eukprot:COSAG02_NODE_48055_length_336_cov_1.282700_1_plen_112_part_11
MEEMAATMRLPAEQRSIGQVGVRARAHPPRRVRRPRARPGIRIASADVPGYLHVLYACTRASEGVARLHTAQGSEYNELHVSRLQTGGRHYGSTVPVQGRILHVTPGHRVNR